MLILIENQGGYWAATAVERRAAILQGEISTSRVLTKFPWRLDGKSIFIIPPPPSHHILSEQMLDSITKVLKRGKKPLQRKSRAEAQFFRVLRRSPDEEEANGYL